MPIKDYSDLTSDHLDVLREIGNIGAGNAASALALMTGQVVDISVPQISILDYEQVTNSLGGPEQLHVALLLFLEGDVTGMIMFMLRREFAHTMLDSMLGSTIGENGELDELGRSAVQEVGNIMAASYVNAISDFTGLSINITVPSVCVDMTGSILSVPAIYYANISDKVVNISGGIHNEVGQTPSHVLLIPEADSLDKIMGSLGLLDE